MTAKDMDVIADIIELTLKDIDTNRDKIVAMVKELVDKYPLY